MSSAIVQHLGPALKRMLPGPYQTLKTVRGRNYSIRFERRLGLHRITRELVAKHGTAVQAGPFTGMKYVQKAAERHAAPKLLGSYECELHGVWERVINGEPDTVIDVGCAEGYYAVGLALRLPRARIYAFDIDRAARRLCRETARANDVADRVVVRGKCDHGQLHTLIRGRALLVSDCEGYEVELLDPVRVPELAGCSIVVELHDCLRPGITQTILTRFSQTHDITLTTTRDRDPSSYHALEFLTVQDRHHAVSEFRTGTMQWALMTPK